MADREFLMMPFDDKTRNRLARFVTDARELIKFEFTEQLQRVYGISATGDITALADLRDLDEGQRALAELLRERVDYLKASSKSEENPSAAAVDRLTREQAFTVLNRLAAIRMAEKRGFIVESVGHGYQSKGFQVYCQIAGSGLGDVYHRFRQYLFCMFDELALDLGPLFDRRSPTSLLFPREPALAKLFDLINAPDIDVLWAEDETIGWIYQYYNDETERKRMREKSPAPRDSRELAVRNQFFTPRYVVEFLTDNTLGRIWYEMTRGDTTLKDRCHYLVRRQSEVFLDSREGPPPEQKTDGLSQEELSKLPVYVPHRPMKDPRDIRLLDPACGSMHFGIYAFDLFEIIYQEAWQLSQGGKLTPPAGWGPLHETYDSKEAFFRDIPRLIIENNIHGIDIDPRAVQIAGLSLWLRAQKRWKEQNISPGDRPQIMRSQIVCAEQMPGNTELLQEFSKRLRPPILGQFLAKVFERMQLAGEAGSLLKIEEDITDLVREAKAQWQKGPIAEQTLLFLDVAKSKQDAFRFDQAGISDEQFWETAEQNIYETLRIYTDQADRGYVHRLFANDAAKGFAFIDLCRNRYDVVLMNPPFGATSLVAKDYTDGRYPFAKEDVDAAFVHRASEFVGDVGLVGAITNRTILFKATLEDWRRAVCFGPHRLPLLADLGLGVLDGALVEAAAYIIQPESGSPSNSVVAVRLMKSSRKGEDLLDTVKELKACGAAEIFFSTSDALVGFPAARFAYYATRGQQAWFRKMGSLSKHGFIVRQGLITGDNFRFVRLIWEIEPNEVNCRWFVLDKGGEYLPYFNDLHLVVDWNRDGLEIRHFSSSGRIASRAQNTDFYFRQGVTYPRRTGSNACFRILPKGAIFDAQAPVILAPQGDDTDTLAIAGLLNSRPVASILELLVASADAVESASAARTYEVGIVEALPIPSLDDVVSSKISSSVRNVWKVLSQRDAFFNECNSSYAGALFSPKYRKESLHATILAALEEEESLLQHAYDETQAINAIVEKLFVIDRDTEARIRGEYGFNPILNANSEIDGPSLSRLYSLSDDDLVDLVASEQTSSRIVTKKAFIVDRRTELLCLYFKCSPKSLFESRKTLALLRSDSLEEAASLWLSFAVGAAFGRLDVRRARTSLEESVFGGPFERIPACQVGALTNDHGLYVESDQIPKDYPLRISWSGILPDDSGHPDDIERRVCEVNEFVWGENGEAIEHEACNILHTRTLREYFRKPTEFFADHLRRYSRSRRQAPIYWPLSTRSGSYTLWLYYPRLRSQTLHACLADFLVPKLKDVSDQVRNLRLVDSSQTRLGELLEFEDELKEMRIEIERVIKLPYDPNLNDGVLITASPLWRLFRLPKWQKDLKACWQELERGDYDWAHLAYSIWPDRVTEKSKVDRSMAIAHGLEHLCSVQASQSKAKRSRKKEATLLEEDAL
jgi:hypothetical protein